jgi:hypothetical protein
MAVILAYEGLKKVTEAIVYANGGDEAAAEDESEFTDKTGKIAEEVAKQLGRQVTAREVDKAIHQVKQKGLGRGGPVKNPDVKVNPRTGDVRPKAPHGLGDVIGNIFDFL